MSAIVTGRCLRLMVYVLLLLSFFRFVTVPDSAVVVFCTDLAGTAKAALCGSSTASGSISSDYALT
jgi:hypothetical protein